MSQLHPLGYATTWGLPSFELRTRTLTAAIVLWYAYTSDRDTRRSWNPGTVSPFGEQLYWAHFSPLLLNVLLLNLKSSEITKSIFLHSISSIHCLNSTVEQCFPLCINQIYHTIN
jgi:hypothetical protein